MTGTSLGTGQPFSKNWQLHDWNEALLKHFFSALSGDAVPVTKLYVTADELKKAVEAADSSPEEVRAQFISTVCETIGARSLGRDAEARGSRWDPESLAVPPFLAHLLLTCMIANDISDDLRKVGDFRQRLTKALGRGVHHGLERIKPLWLLLSGWLLKHTGPPRSGRPLQLPNVPSSGRFCIIGYSLWLAFPTRKDQITLAEILCNGRITRVEEVPITEILGIVGRNLSRFSSGFKDVFDDFRRAYGHTPLSALYNTSFWSVLTDSVFKIQSKDHLPEASIRVRLEAEEEDGRFWLNLTTDHEMKAARFQTIPIPATRTSPYTHLITINTEQGAKPASTCVLDPALRPVVIDVSPPAVLNSAGEGFLLFERSEDGPFEYTSHLPASGELIALIGERIAAPLRECFKAFDLRSDISSSIYAGWSEVRDLRAEKLLELDLSTWPTLSVISSLRRIIPAPRIRLIGGVRIENGYLLAEAFMPVAEIADATAVVALCHDGTEVGLVQNRDVPSLWAFPSDSIERLEGPVQLLAKRLEGFLATKAVQFSAQAYSTAFKGSSDVSRWLVEMASADLEPIPGTSSLTEVQDGRRYVETEAPRHAVQGFTQSDRTLELGQFFDALAAVFVRRKGIPEHELVELVVSTLGVPAYKVWPLLQAWIDQGILDCLVDRRWRARVYFGRRPALYSYVASGGNTIVLTGLAPTLLIDRFNESASRLTLESLPRQSPNANVPPLAAVRSSSHHQTKRFADELELDLPAVVPHPRTLIRPLPANPVAVGPEPLGWPTFRTWDWTLRRFAETAADNERAGFSLVWCRRDDGPDYYKIRRTNKTRYWSRSRNWRLLILNHLLGNSSFGGEESTIEPCYPRLYLPLPLARFAAIVGPKAPGIESGMGQEQDTYRYTLPNRHCRNEVLATFYEEPSAGLEEAIRRIAKASPSRQGRVVPVPLVILQKLATMRQSTLANIPLDFVPDHVLPELFRLIGLAETFN
jgi:hypothetical protein